MSDNIFTNAENAYIKCLLRANETILWRGHPEILGFADKKWILILGLSGISGSIIYLLLNSSNELFFLSILFSIIFLLLGASLINYILDERPGNTEYYITSRTIIKIKYRTSKAKRTPPSFYLLSIPFIPPIMRMAHHYRHHPITDEVVSLELDDIKEITYKSWKKNDNNLTHITFYGDYGRIFSSEIINGEFVSKPTRQTTIKFFYIEDWSKIRQILDDILPYTIPDLSI